MTACANCPASPGPLCDECEALRWACGYVLGIRRRGEGHEHGPLGIAAHATLSDPARAAERLRAMLEVRGVELAGCHNDAGRMGITIVLHTGTPIVPWWWKSFSYATIPALILRLIEEAPRTAADARERALAVLEAAIHDQKA